MSLLNLGLKESRVLEIDCDKEPVVDRFFASESFLPDQQVLALTASILSIFLARDPAYPCPLLAATGADHLAELCQGTPCKMDVDRQISSEVRQSVGTRGQNR